MNMQMNSSYVVWLFADEIGRMNNFLSNYRAAAAINK